MARWSSYDFFMIPKIYNSNNKEVSYLGHQNFFFFKGILGYILF